MKRTIAKVVGLGAVVAVALTGCAAQDAGTDEATDDPGLYYFIDSVTDPFITANNEGAAARAEELGLTFRTSTAGGDAARQFQLVNDAVAAGATAIITTPLSSEALAPAIDAANEAGVCTIALYGNFGTAPQTEVYGGSKAFVGWDDTEAGRTLAAAMGEQMGGSGDVGVLLGTVQGTDQQRRVEGMRAEFEENYPDIKIVDVQPTDWDPANARAVTQDWLQKYGASLKGIAGVGDDLSTAAADVINDSALAGEVTIGGFGGSELFAGYIEDGLTFATIPYTPVQDGSTAIDLAKACADGDSTPVIADQTVNPTLKDLQDQGYLVTGANLDLFDPEY